MNVTIKTLVVENNKNNSETYASHVVRKFGQGSFDIANNFDSAVRLLQKSEETKHYYMNSIIGRQVPWRADFSGDELFGLIEYMFDSWIPYNHILILRPKLEVLDNLKKKGVILYEGNGHKVCEELKSIDDFLSRKNGSSFPQQNNQ